ncbi:copper amine oxidase [Metarhizium brunneum]
MQNAVVTVTNCEYIFAFHFAQDAEVHYEVCTTGILWTSQRACQSTTPSSTIVESEQGLDLDVAKNHVFKIVNEGKTNDVTRTPVGLKLVPCCSQLLLAHAVWVTRYHDDELFPAGRCTMRSRGGEGLASMIAKRSARGTAPRR